jgi:hypothetical protein
MLQRTIPGTTLTRLLLQFSPICGHAEDERAITSHQSRRVSKTRNHMTFTWPTAPSTSFCPFPSLIGISYPLQASSPSHPSHLHFCIPRGRSNDLHMHPSARNTAPPVPFSEIPQSQSRPISTSSAFPFHHAKPNSFLFEKMSRD